MRDIARRGDNLLKLGRASCDRRILFIEIAPSCYNAWAGIIKAEPPLVVPDLPVEVTEVWLAASIVNDHVIWRWDRGHGWRSQVVTQRIDPSGRAV